MEKKNNCHQIEGGNRHDIITEISIAQGDIKKGKYKEGISQLHEIRVYIDHSDVNQNLRYLLPGIDAEIAHAEIAHAKALEQAIAFVLSDMQSGQWGRDRAD